MITVTARFPDELNKLLEEYCAKEDRSKSWVLRKFLQEGLDEWVEESKKGSKKEPKKKDKKK